MGRYLVWFGHEDALRYVSSTTSAHGVRHWRMAKRYDSVELARRAAEGQAAGLPFGARDVRELEASLWVAWTETPAREGVVDRRYLRSQFRAMWATDWQWCYRFETPDAALTAVQTYAPADACVGVSSIAELHGD